MTDATDKAGKLHLLISKIQKIGRGFPGNPELYKVLDRIATEIGENNSTDLVAKFHVLCSSIQFELQVMPLAKESVRNNFIDCMNKISSVFRAQNYGEHANSIFSRHFSSENMNTLDYISNSFQSAGLIESNSETLEEALLSIKELIDEVCLVNKIDKRIVLLLKNYINQIELIFSTVKIYGDDEFWKKYKEILSIFLQMNDLIAGFENKDKIIAKFKNATGKLMYGTAFGFSLLANAGTIKDTLIPYIFGK